jgi:hypothetical protein
MVRRAEDAVDIADGEARRHEAHVDAERIELALQPTTYPPRCNGTGFVTKQGTHALDVWQAGGGDPCPDPDAGAADIPRGGWVGSGGRPILKPLTDTRQRRVAGRALHCHSMQHEGPAEGCDGWHGRLPALPPRAHLIHCERIPAGTPRVARRVSAQADAARTRVKAAQRRAAPVPVPVPVRPAHGRQAAAPSVRCTDVRRGCGRMHSAAGMVSRAPSTRCRVPLRHDVRCPFGMVSRALSA